MEISYFYIKYLKESLTVNVIVKNKLIKCSPLAQEQNVEAYQYNTGYLAKTKAKNK